MEKKFFPFENLQNVKYLFCVSQYPAPKSKIKFSKKFFEKYDGFSDHTLGLDKAKQSISLGAKILEKHFTLDKNLPGPDHILSILPHELKELHKYRLKMINEKVSVIVCTFNQGEWLKKCLDSLINQKYILKKILKLF